MAFLRLIDALECGYDDGNVACDVIRGEIFGVRFVFDGALASHLSKYGLAVPEHADYGFSPSLCLLSPFLSTGCG